MIGHDMTWLVSLPNHTLPMCQLRKSWTYSASPTYSPTIK